MADHRALALLLLMAEVACDSGEPGEVEPPTGSVDVVVSSPLPGPIPQAYPATVASTNQAKLATRTSGEVQRVLVDVGSEVSRGQRLLRLDAAAVQADVAGARAQLRRAQQRYRRMAALARDGAATQQELDDARAALDSAQAALRGKRAQEDYVVLRAPFAGVITRRMVDPGDLAVPGQPLLVLMGRGPLEIVADLPAQFGATVEPGDEATVIDPDTGARYPARVTRTSESLDQESRRIRVEARFGAKATSKAKAPPLLPGGFVRLELGAAAAPTLWIPKDAVIRRGQLTGVYVLREDALRLRWVRLGASHGRAVEVLAGVTRDAEVVRRPGPAVADGQKAGAVQKEPWSPPEVRGPKRASK